MPSTLCVPRGPVTGGEGVKGGGNEPNVERSVALATPAPSRDDNNSTVSADDADDGAAAKNDHQRASDRFNVPDFSAMSGDREILVVYWERFCKVLAWRASRRATAATRCVGSAT